MSDPPPAPSTPPPLPVPSAPRRGGFGLRPAWLFPARISRRHFLLRWLLSQLLAGAGLLVFVQLLSDPHLGTTLWAQISGGLIFLCVGLLHGYTLLFITFARMRDIGWPAWVILIPLLPISLGFLLIPFLKSIFGLGLLLIPGLRDSPSTTGR